MGREKVSYGVRDVEFAPETPSADDVLDIGAVPPPTRGVLIFREKIENDCDTACGAGGWR